MARAMVCSIRMGGARDRTSWVSCAVVVRECVALHHIVLWRHEGLPGLFGKLRLFHPRHNCARMLASAI
ncbi:hypothetical protein BDV34DRAFT_186483 [Aspergillus parasiticus]|uniref:Uncharacterized protein n=1 Tax=Aspergillus parasiticus TaxID=5067 RepID=A0A5N6E012_ASPPA|nr:hypothetical protein BDV34DRAFT_186483 [Aspergillus parasiticus]